MSEHLLEIGVGGIFAVVLIREVLSAFTKLQETRKRKTSYPPPSLNAPTGCPSSASFQQIDQIYQIVSRTDGQGRALIYTPAETGKLLERIVYLLETEKDHHKQIIRLLKEETTGQIHVDE